MLKKMLKDYADLEKQIHAYFGFEGRWQVHPLEDLTDNAWFLLEDVVVFTTGAFTDHKMTSGSELYSGVCTAPPECVYKTADYTMLVVDLQSDGNKFLMIFSNALECDDVALIKAYKDNWG